MASTKAPARSAQRTRIMWFALIGASTLVFGILALDGKDRVTPPVAWNVTEVGPSAPGSSIQPREAQLNAGRWKAIVIHHSATPGGSWETIERQHLAQGRAGLGHHFLIGNGQGMGDGAVHVGYRWDRQLPGAHLSPVSITKGSSVARIAALSSDNLRDDTISICLVGNGDRRPFTDRQIGELSELVSTLQAQLGINSSRIVLSSDMPGGAGPGQYFAASIFESNLNGIGVVSGSSSN
ncbi:MAG: peptidoglycan recognition family protein [Planctomycetota bacterium]|nr:peptidoglycan recognition family protein [Planctomycetota bacterium]